MFGECHVANRASSGLPTISRRSRIIAISLAVVALLLMFGPRLVDAYTNWLWFGETGYRSVYVKMLLTRILVGVVVALLVGGTLFAALVMAYRTRPVFVPVAGPNDPLARYRATVVSRLRSFGVTLPIVVGLLCGLIAQTNWTTVQLFLHGGDFNIDDPQFGLDVGFYAFDLPFYHMLLGWLFTAIVLAFIANLVTHYIFGGLRLSGRDGALTRSARVQLAVLAGTFVLLKAVAYWFDRYSLLSSSRKEPTFTGAGFTDINAVLPAKLILLSIALVCAIAFFGGIFLRDLRIPALATALLVFSSILIGAVWPLAIEQFSVRPQAAQKEAEYIQRNIAATRQAYGITNVVYEPYSGEGTKDPADVPADRTTIEYARLLDPNVLGPTFNQQINLKNIYGFKPSLDIDRYTISGKMQDYIVAARELAPGNFQGNQRDWINRHTVYTHGDGFVVAQANKVNAAPGDSADTSNSGYPRYQVSDLASQKANQLIKVTQPRIYYGELISQEDPDYAIVGAAKGEAPREYDTDTTQYTYDGKGGVPVGNWFNRLAFAAKYMEGKIILGGLNDNSKLIFNRDPRDRVTEVAPWLTTDGDAYPAVVGGRIVWIVDAYTTLANYPYAQKTALQDSVNDSIDQTTGRALPQKEVSYIRNSVKATVDAYDGTITLYQVDDKDPVLKAWMGVFPGTVKPQSAISKELRDHFRYPEDLFKVQREMLTRYHVDDPREFFTNNAFWSVPDDPTVDGGDAGPQPPYYVLMGDQKSGKPVFNLTSAMVGFNRPYLSAYIMASSDPATYGKLTVLQLPTDSQTQGPQQMQSSMTTTDRVANGLTLLQGSNAIKYGNLLTYPFADGGVLYVEPLYTERKNTTTSFPQLSRVLVSYRLPSSAGGVVRVGYAPTLEEALTQVFGDRIASEAATADQGGGTPPAQPNQPNPPNQQGGASNPARDAAVKEIDASLEAVRTAQTSGDLGQLGAAFDRLDKAIKAYEALGG
ncbi:UPF0182 family protein [Smaragdicoccus niigatensis]|uniref:UPF0182 family protein n=1 Tax=Smaragdicoccus niigatensis TaxID=359359 RepID=UPI00068784FC|nr:UPF0182 family protein [Smaragdicoccus niigatensis]